MPALKAVQHRKRAERIRTPAALAKPTLVELGPAGEDVVERKAQAAGHLAGHKLHMVGPAPGEGLGCARHKAHGVHARKRLGAEPRLRGLDHARRQIAREPALLGVLVGAHHAVVGPLEHRVAAMRVQVGDDLEQGRRGLGVGAVLRPGVVVAGQAGAALGAHEGAERGAAARAGRSLVYLVHEVAAARAQQVAHGVAAHAARRPEHLRERLGAAPKRRAPRPLGLRPHPRRQGPDPTGPAPAPSRVPLKASSPARIAPPPCRRTVGLATTLPHVCRQERVGSMEFQRGVTET